MNLKPLALTIGLFLSPAALAVPFLQLDIAGGEYIGGNEESVITTSPTFTLYAHAERGKKLADSKIVGANSDTFYLSAALTPNDGLSEHDTPDLGSFDITYLDDQGVLQSQTVNVTADMTWGVPPLEANGTADHDGGDMGKHDIFETWFSEFAFKFTGDESATYNVQDNGGQGFLAGTGSYIADFVFDLTNLASGYDLHFDLYHQKIKNSDYDIDYHAPYSKDAGTNITQVVSEPATVLTLLGGVLLIAGIRRRRTTLATAA